MAGQGVKDRKPMDDSPIEVSYLCDDPALDNLMIPAVPCKRGCGRITIRKVDAIVQIESPTKVTTRLVANIDPNYSFMPQSLLEFIMKHLAGKLC
jgi:hypothetical protein